MKCLHICNDFLGSKVHQNLYNELNENGIEQVLFYPTRLKKSKIEKDSEENFLYPVYASKPLKLYHKLLFNYKINYLYRDLIKKIKLNPIDVTHATTLYSDGALAYKLYEKFNIPYVVTVRSTDLEVFLRFRIDLFPMLLKILKNTQRIIFVSDSLYQKFFSHQKLSPYETILKEKSQIIYNGVAANWLNDRYKKHTLKPHKIICISSLIKRKNIGNLVKAVLDLARKFPEKNFQLCMVGDGPLKRNILKLERENPNVITYFNPIEDRNELKELLRQNHVFALPSVKETFGLVYIEALSQGLPIVGIVNEGIYGIFDHPIGCFAKDSSIKSIKESILKTVTHYSSLDIDNINLDQFNWPTIAKSHLSLYKYAVIEHSKFLQ